MNQLVLKHWRSGFPNLVSYSRFSDRILLRRRAILETIIDQLKNSSQIEHSRHRSIANFFVDVLCGLIAYCHRSPKPSLDLDYNLPLTA